MKVMIFSAFDPIPGDGLSLLRYGIIAEKLAERGHEVEYVSSTFSHTQAAQRKDTSWKRNIQVALIPAPGYRSSSPKRLISYLILANNLNHWLNQKSDKPDIAICATPPVFCSYFLTTWAKKNNVPCIVDIQDLWPQAFERLMPKSIIDFFGFPIKWAADKSVRNADGLAAVSKDYFKFFGKEGHTFYLGTESSKFIPFPMESVNQKRVMMFSSSQAGQYVPQLEKAAEILPDVGFTIAGLRKNQFQIQYSFIKKKVRNIKTIPWMTRGQIFGELSSYSCGLVLVDPRTHSAMPNRAINCLSAGLPIVNNIRGGELEKIIADNDLGITIQNDKPDTIAEGIRYCISKYSNADHERIRKFASEIFNSDNIYSAYCDWIERIRNRIT